MIKLFFYWLKTNFEDIIRLLVTIVLILGTLHFLKFKMFQIPYDQNVWGNVSDWLSLLVTSAGTLYIALSFSEQKKINKEQKKINQQQYDLYKISMEKDRREIRPFFKIYFQTTVKDGQRLILNLENAIAEMVMIEYFSDGNYLTSGEQLYKNEWDVNDKAIIIVRKKRPDEENTGGSHIAHIKFKDELGRSYEQYLSYTERDLSATVPREIENYSIWG